MTVQAFRDRPKSVELTVTCSAVSCRSTATPSAKHSTGAVDNKAANNSASRRLRRMTCSCCLAMPTITKPSIIIIIEHLIKHICLTAHQSSCRFTLIDMKINRHIKPNMLKTQYSTKIYACRFYQVVNRTLSHRHCYM